MTILFILLGVFLSVGANEVVKPSPCEHGTYIAQKQVEGGIVETRTCYEGGSHE